MMKLLLLRGNQSRQSSPMPRMLDKQGKPLEPCFFLFCADDPIGRHSLVPGSLRAEEFPSELVCAKHLLLSRSELGALALFVRIDARLFFATGSKGRETCRMHQTRFLELLDAFDVNGAPGAGGPARSETNCVTGFVDAPSNAVDPAEAESCIYGFRPGDARFSRVFFVEAHHQFGEFVVMGFEPSSEVKWRREECWFWRHGVQSNLVIKSTHGRLRLPGVGGTPALPRKIAQPKGCAT